jgi:hypothetical protein
MASARTDLVAAAFETVIVSLFAVVDAGRESPGTVVAGRVSHESMLQRLVPLLVPLEVADHFLLLDEDTAVAVQTVKVLPVVEIATLTGATLSSTAEPGRGRRVSECGRTNCVLPFDVTCVVDGTRSVEGVDLGTGHRTCNNETSILYV